MIAVDTNILVYASDRGSDWHGPARECIAILARGRIRWALPWPCIYEFYNVVTHPRILRKPYAPLQALAQVDAWLESPVASLLAEGREHWPVLRELLVAAKVEGPLVHDARIASICIAAGVTELLSADRDFDRFPMLRTRNPLPGT